MSNLTSGCIPYIYNYYLVYVQSLVFVICIFNLFIYVMFLLSPFTVQTVFQCYLMDQ